MSERKVLNKYYPPDFDPAKIPRLRLPKTRQYTVRVMIPFNMRCNTCGDYIGKAKKFNARKETVENEEYLGLKIFRFYFKCPTCMAEITFKTDPKKCDYELEHGATRNFQALRLAEQQAEREEKEMQEEEKLNPIKMLEKRTDASRREMEALQELEELKDRSERNIGVNCEDILSNKKKEVDEILKKQEEEDEAFVQRFLESRKNQMLGKQEIEEEIIEEVVEKTEKSNNLMRIVSLAAPSKDVKNEKRKLTSLVRIKNEKKQIIESVPIMASAKSISLCAYDDSESDENT